MRVLFCILLVMMLLAYGCQYWFNLPIPTFSVAAIALVIISKLLGVGVQQFSHYLGERVAGLLSITLSNLVEIIIVFIAILHHNGEVVRGGIVGSIVGNLLLNMGISIVVSCKKYTTVNLNPHVVTLYINQLFLVSAILFLPRLANSFIAIENHTVASYWLAIILAATYLYYHIMSLRDPRMKQVIEQTKQWEKIWSKKVCVFVILFCTGSAFAMSTLLINQVETVAATFDLSKEFIGFILVPLVGNIAENATAIYAAAKGMHELSLSISVGSASQVGMLIAPCAVLFGVLTGNPFSLDFSGMPVGILAVSIIGAFVVLRDNQWNKSEGIMLIAYYFAVASTLALTR